MNNITGPYVLHSLVIALLQFLVLKDFRVPVLDAYSISAFIYPLFIIMMPLKTPRSLLILLAFLFGLMADFFYHSPGVHAATLLITAYSRSFILKVLEPRGGYRTEDAPTIKNYGMAWFLTYAAILLTIHLLCYFSIEAFTFVYIDKIIINAVLSFVVSYFLILFYQIFMRS